LPFGSASVFRISEWQPPASNLGLKIVNFVLLAGRQVRTYHGGALFGEAVITYWREPLDAV
jgi:hypothetical protein